MLTRRAMIAATAAAPGAIATRASAQSTPPAPHTFDELLRDPVVSDAAISPDGEQLAVLRTQTQEGKTRAFVLLSQTRNMEAKAISVPVGEYQVDQVEWAKNDRLLIWLTLWKDAKGRPYGIAFGNFIFPIPMRRVISIDIKGGDGVLLFNDVKGVIRKSFNAARVVDLMHDDPKLVLMQAWDPARDAYSLYHVDVYTGHAEVVEKGPPATDGWLTQRGVPMLRLDSNRRGTVVSVYARAPGETEWKLVRKSRRTELQKLPDFDIVGPTEEVGVFLVCMRNEGEEHKTLRRLDIRTLEFGPPLGDRAPRDIEGAVIDEGLKLVATSGQGHRVEYSFTDPTLAAHYKAIDGALKNVCNVRLFDISLDHKRLLLHSTGPAEPGAFHLYDRDTKRLHIVAVAKPWLDPARLATMETLTVRTRDGAEISAYLSTPPGSRTGPQPMVVLAHGGPEDRDTYDYHLFVQALASKGWLVLQPNFRGSGGFGRAFAEAGHRRWASRMQQDVEDAVDHLVAAGRADPKRLAICGGSYGGYAAMMGPIVRPGLYRCAVSIAGASDLLEMLKHERDDDEDSPSYRYWVSLIGDPKTDAAQIKAASPRIRAAELGIPLLLLHGSADNIVPAAQSQLMAKALKAAGKTYEHHELPGEGHRNWSTENYKLILEKTTTFIAKHI